MLNPDNTKINVYDFFKSEIENRSLHRLVGVISCKQMCLYAQIQPERDNGQTYYYDHWGLVDLLHQEMQPGVKKHYGNGDYDGQVHIFSLGNNVTIDLPNCGLLSKMQATFLIDLLDVFEKINSEYTDDNKKIRVFFCNFNPKYRHTSFDDLDIKAMKESVLDSITYGILDQREQIIGKTLSDEEMINALKFHLDPNNYKDSSTLLTYARIIESYMRDEYYKKYIPLIIPNYEKIIKQIDVVSLLNIELPFLSFENIEEELNNCILSMFNDISLDNLKKLAETNDYSIEKLEEYYPLVLMVSKVLRIIFNMYDYQNDSVKEIFNERINDIHNYEDLVQLTADISNLLLENKLNRIKQTKEIYDNQLKLKNILDKKEQIEQLVKKYAEIEDLIEKTNKDIFHISLLYIRESASKVKIDLLQKKEKKLNEKLELLNDSKLSIEHIFEEITGLDKIYLKYNMLDSYYSRQVGDVDYYQKQVINLENEFSELEIISQSLNSFSINKDAVDTKK